LCVKSHHDDPQDLHEHGLIDHHGHADHALVDQLNRRLSKNHGHIDHEIVDQLNRRLSKNPGQYDPAIVEHLNRRLSKNTIHCPTTSGHDDRESEFSVQKVHWQYYQN